MLSISSMLRTCAAALLLSACSPALYLSMKPSQGSGIWQSGHERTILRQDSVLVSMGFVRYEGDALLFTFDIQNQSGKAVLVAPEQFSYTPVATTLKRGEQYIPYFPKPVRAINPELKLDRLSAAVVYNVQQANAQGFHFTELARQESMLHSTAALQAQVQQKDVEARLLRKQTLLPGQGIEGYVYFPRTDGADVLQLSLPLRAQPLLLSYQQLRSAQPYGN